MYHTRSEELNVNWLKSLDWIKLDQIHYALKVKTL